MHGVERRILVVQEGWHIVPLHDGLADDSPFLTVLFVIQWDFHYLPEMEIIIREYGLL